MAVDRNMLLRAMVLAAVKNGTAADKTPIAILEEVIVGRFDSEITRGKTVISTTEAGGSVSFSVPSELTPADAAALAMEAVAWIKAQPDPSNPDIYPRRIKRLRASFAKAQTS